MEHVFFCILTINRLEISEKALDQSDIHILGKFKQLHDKATVDESYLDSDFSLRVSVPTSVLL